MREEDIAHYVDFGHIDRKDFEKRGLNDQYSDRFTESHKYHSPSPNYKENKILRETSVDSDWVHHMIHLFENAPTENFEKDPFVRQNTSAGDCEDFYPSFKENLYKVLNYSFNVPKKYLEMLNLDDAGIKNLTESDSNSPYPVIAAAASSNHFHEIQGLIRDYHRNLLPIYPDMKLILFDLGLNAKQLKLMKKHCRCEVRKFPFHIFPDHIRILSGYGWKPLIIQLLLQEFDFVMWTDASVRFNGRPLDKLFQGAKEVGVQAIPGWGSIAVRTNQRTFTALGEEMCLFDYPEFEATWMAFVRSEFTLTAVMRPLVSCALQYGCMDFKNSKSFLGCPLRKKRFGACHRFDQSVIGIILARLFNYKSHLCQFIVNGIGSIKRGEYVNYFPNS
ncbi:uncharacterized protein LOC133185049 [Saccostrea echinata]|uniref:uncharacterized protein LOC133185049 n=1 Tax=Saccostrea echinata TaxID=191078 RepID=UPI002A836689|nr:uncharacterized protein LOC133185049 [Saccostrea echinata]